MEKQATPMEHITQLKPDYQVWATWPKDTAICQASFPTMESTKTNKREGHFPPITFWAQLACISYRTTRRNVYIWSLHAQLQNIKIIKTHNNNKEKTHFELLTIDHVRHRSFVILINLNAISELFFVLERNDFKISFWNRKEERC